jgi:NAD(P)H-flavin reductase
MRRWRARILQHRRLSPTAYELTLSRDGLEFRAGQLLIIHGRSVVEDRAYTIAGGEQDDELRVLYRLIPTGVLTPQLATKSVGDFLEISGPCGEFVLRDRSRPIVFIATGTGIAPCRAYLRTHPDLNITILHGVRVAEDLFYREEFLGRPYYPCLSADTRLGFHGRVTEFSRTFAFPANAHYYLCGANEMFYDMRDVLFARGVSPDAIFTEAYYYRHEE